jgi:hypothetical protein
MKKLALSILLLPLALLAGTQYSDTNTANLFIGPLQGNAATATTATNDSAGNNIATTYYPASNPSAFISTVPVSATNQFLGTYGNASGLTNIPLTALSNNTNNTLVITNGRVGVGTGGPIAPLDIFYSTAINGPMLSIRSDLATVGKFSMIRFGDQSQSSGYQKGAIIYEGLSTSARGRFHIALQNDDSSTSVGLADARLTVQSDGSVGIGTNAPGYKLHVVGSIYGSYISTATNTSINAGVIGKSVGSVVTGTNYWVNDIGGGSFTTNHIP